MWANNETGIIFPIEEIGEIIKPKSNRRKGFRGSKSHRHKHMGRATQAEIDYVISVLAMIAKNLKTGVSLSSTASA